MSQKAIFLESEGDQYLLRHRVVVADVEKMAASDQVLAALRRLSLNPRSALEVGCSNGWRLEAIRREYGAKCCGVDPSSLAVTEGTAQYPELSLRVGTADRLPFDDIAFDVVIFGFCLHLCDRGDLFQVAAEADRVLKDGGHIAILDFCPPFPYRNDYKHHPGVHAYKMNYSNLFLWNPAYTCLSQKVFAHQDAARVIDPDERISVSVLLKYRNHAYPGNPFRQICLEQ